MSRLLSSLAPRRLAAVLERQTGGADPAPGVSRAVLSPDGRLLVLTYVNRFNVFDWRAGKDIVSNQTLAESARIRIDGAHFSPDGRYVLLFSSGYSTELWDLETGKKLTRIQLPDQGVVQAVFDPKGERVIVALRDGELRQHEAARKASEVAEFATTTDEHGEVRRRPRRGLPAKPVLSSIAGCWEDASAIGRQALEVTR